MIRVTLIWEEPRVLEVELGNPGGFGSGGLNGNTIIGQRGSSGTGGLIVLFATQFSNSKIIESNGSNGGYGNRAGGGGSGGGSINIFYKEQINKGTVNANGGKGGDSAGWKVYGGDGGNGSITIGNISTGTFIKD